MQHVAAEMNLSETAFLHPQNGGYSLRWFTPAIEVDLCGHATLASAHALWETERLDEKAQARFHTRSGLLTAERKGDWIELNFPATPEHKTDPPPQLLEALGVRATYVGRNKFDYLVEVESEETVRAIRPDHALLRKLPVRGVIVTSRASEYDFISRFFAPGSGIDEDPVTGSAHCALAPYWAAKLGKTELRAFQASPRGGFVNLRTDGDRVRLGGQAVTVLMGELLA
jgi:PhzF family phenazine biosynthesis protein